MHTRWKTHAKALLSFYRRLIWPTTISISTRIWSGHWCVSYARSISCRLMRTQMTATVTITKKNLWALPRLMKKTWTLRVPSGKCPRGPRLPSMIRENEGTHDEAPTPMFWTEPPILSLTAKVKSDSSRWNLARNSSFHPSRSNSTWSMQARHLSRWDRHWLWTCKSFKQSHIKALQRVRREIRIKVHSSAQLQSR